MPKETDKYRDDYIRESKEHVDGLNKALLVLEKMPGDKASIEHLFRHVHTLKSMSAAMQFSATEKLCHALEGLLDKIKKQEVDSEGCIDFLFKACDLISKTIVCLEDGKAELNTDKMVRSLQSAMKSDGQPKKENAPIDDTGPQPLDKVRSINVKVERLDRLMNLSEEFLINRLQLDVLQTNIKDRELTLVVEKLARHINELQYLVVQARLVPLDYIFNRFPRMVRDLAKSENKKIDLQIQGGSVELDRVIIDELGECLVHLLRNAVDHGIESKEQRLKSKKFEFATLMINAYRRRSTVVVEVSDDGSGLPMNKIRQKAQAMKLLRPNAVDEQVIDTIFSGLSTSETVNSVSGRGVGLNIVKRKIESLGGRIEVKTQVKKGTTFLLELPLTLAIVRVLFVEVNKEKYAIPINHIIRLVKLPKAHIKPLMQTEAIVIEEEEIPMVRLNRVFNEPESEQEKIPIVIVQHKGHILGIAVDRFKDMQDVVIKPMNNVVKRNHYFSGSTVIGNGTVVLILDVMGISTTYAPHSHELSNET